MAEAAKGDVDLTDPAILGKAQLDGGDDVAVTFDHTVTGDPRFRFCTEACVKLKEGESRDSVLAAFTQCIEADDAMGDSLVVVGGPTREGGQMAKLHIHTNDPSKVFEQAGRHSSEAEGRVWKQKVEDMFYERELAHGAPLYDMSNAKFAVVCDGIALPERDMRAGFMVPVYVIPASTGEPLMCGDFVNDNPLPLFQKLRNAPERVFTAAPTPINVQMIVEQALAQYPRVVVAMLAGWGSATYRNSVAAVKALSEEDQKRVTCVDTGYILNEEGLFQRVLLRQAAAGATVEEAIARAEFVCSRAYHQSFLSSGSVKVIAKTGRLPSLGDGSSIQDGQRFIMGNMPPDMYAVERPNPPASMWKVHTMLGMVDQCAPGAEAQAEMEAKYIAKLKEATAGKKLRDLVVHSVGRPDVAHRYARLFKEELGVDEAEVTVCESNALGSATALWGDTSVFYWME